MQTIPIRNGRQRPANYADFYPRIDALAFWDLPLHEFSTNTSSGFIPIEYLNMLPEEVSSFLNQNRCESKWILVQACSRAEREMWISFKLGDLRARLQINQSTFFPELVSEQRKDNSWQVVNKNRLDWTKFDRGIRVAELL